MCLSVMVCLSGVLVASVGHSDDGFETTLRTRSEKIFAYDQNVGALPARALFGLSIAMKFHDYTGAERYINALEQRMK